MTHLTEDFPDPTIHQFSAAARALGECTLRPEFLASSESSFIEAEFRNTLEARDTRVLSLDVFDTFLLRNNVPETQRYLDISRRIVVALEDALKNGSSKTWDEHDLLLQRLRALELTYRTRAAVEGCREGSLTDALKIQKLALGLPLDADITMLRVELEYEAEGLKPNPVLSSLARKFRESGGKVILLSDMYLGKREITEIIRLVDEGLQDCFDDVYSSADVILSKRSGKVFGMVAKTLEQKPEHFLHIGDSWHSDVHMARLAGWPAMHFPISKYEQFCREKNLKTFVQSMYSRSLDISRWAKI